MLMKMFSGKNVIFPDHNDKNNNNSNNNTNNHAKRKRGHINHSEEVKMMARVMFAQGAKKCTISRKFSVAESTLRGWLKQNYEVFLLEPCQIAELVVEPPSKVVKFVQESSKFVKSVPMRNKVDPPKVVEFVDLTSDDEDEDLKKKKELMKALGLMSHEDLRAEQAVKKLRRSRREPIPPVRLNDYAKKWI